MDDDQFPKSIILRWPMAQLHSFSYKKLAAEFYKQRGPATDLAYVLPIIFLHMHLESLLFQNLATIQFACRAGVSSAYTYTSRELRNFVRQSRQGDLIGKIKLLSDTLVLDNVNGVDTSLVNEKEKGYMTRLINTRDYLIHCCHMTEPLLRMGGSTYPLQEANLGKDVEDAFRIMLVLELRLISTLRHIEATLFECVCEADLSVCRPRESLAFRSYIFKNQNNRFRAVVSRTEFPMPRISRLAESWEGFFNFDYLYWPVGDYEESLGDALSNVETYITKKWKKDGKVSPLEKHEVHWSPPHINTKEWPWTKYSPTDSYTTQQLKKLLKE